MIGSSWLVFAIFAFFCWGISDFLPKIATNKISPKSAYFFESIGRFSIGLIVLIFFLKFKLDFSLTGFFVSLASGFLGGLGMLSFFLAASRGKISQVVLLTALYPMLTTMLAIFLLGEDMSIRQGIGVFLAAGALYLLS